MSAVATSSPQPASVRSVWMVGLAYVVAFLLLDWVSYIRPFQGLNITPWNPQPALAVALLLRHPSKSWLVWCSLVTAELAVRGVPGDWFAMLVAAAALALSYAAIARALRLKLNLDLALATRADLLWFTVIVVAGALFSGTVYVLTYAVVAGNNTGSPLGAIARYWVGDAVGMVVLLPMLLVLIDPIRRTSLMATLRSRDWWLIAALIGILMAIVFARDDSDHFKFFYLLLLPVVWASARLGLAGAVLAAALTQVSLIAAVQLVTSADLTVFELQALMAAVTMTGLMLGVAVDERTRTAAELKGSLRLAAAGQMAAALAHELSQPLTALSSYAEASRMIISSKDMGDDQRLSHLAEVSARMAEEAMRASRVVKRLRDFFRSGSTQLRPTALAGLLAEAVAANARRGEALRVAIECEIEGDLPHAWMDPVQISVVLRNLVTNAMDAACDGDALRRVRIRACERRGALLVEVLDSGPGVPASRLQALFDSGPSDKPGGMGVGLSICRAIIEAHGGALWAEPGSAGHFSFTLPVGEPGVSGVHHAP